MVNSNLFNFLELLDSLSSTPQDLLHIIIGLEDKTPEETFTKLLIRVCSLFKWEDFCVTSAMIEKVMAISLRREKIIEQPQDYLDYLLRTVYHSQLLVEKP